MLAEAVGDLRNRRHRVASSAEQSENKERRGRDAGEVQLGLKSVPRLQLRRIEGSPAPAAEQGARQGAPIVLRKALQRAQATATRTPEDRRAANAPLHSSPAQALARPECLGTPGQASNHGQRGQGPQRTRAKASQTHLAPPSPLSRLRELQVSGGALRGASTAGLSSAQVRGAGLPPSAAPIARREVQASLWQASPATPVRQTCSGQEPRTPVGQSRHRPSSAAQHVSRLISTLPDEHCPAKVLEGGLHQRGAYARWSWSFDSGDMERPETMPASFAQLPHSTPAQSQRSPRTPTGQTAHLGSELLSMTAKPTHPLRSEPSHVGERKPYLNHAQAAVPIAADLPSRHLAEQESSGVPATVARLAEARHVYHVTSTGSSGVDSLADTSTPRQLRLPQRQTRPSDSTDAPPVSGTKPVSQTRTSAPEARNWGSSHPSLPKSGGKRSVLSQAVTSKRSVPSQAIKGKHGRSRGTAHRPAHWPQRNKHDQEQAQQSRYAAHQAFKAAQAQGSTVRISKTPWGTTEADAAGQEPPSSRSGAALGRTDSDASTPRRSSTTREYSVHDVLETHDDLTPSAAVLALEREVSSDMSSHQGTSDVASARGAVAASGDTLNLLEQVLSSQSGVLRPVSGRKPVRLRRASTLPLRQRQQRGQRVEAGELAALAEEKAARTKSRLRAEEGSKDLGAHSAGDEVLDTDSSTGDSSRFSSSSTAEDTPRPVREVQLPATSDFVSASDAVLQGLGVAWAPHVAVCEDPVLRRSVVEDGHGPLLNTTLAQALHSRAVPRALIQSSLQKLDRSRPISSHQLQTALVAASSEKSVAAAARLPEDRREGASHASSESVPLSSLVRMISGADDARDERADASRRQRAAAHRQRKRLLRSNREEAWRNTASVQGDGASQHLQEAGAAAVDASGSSDSESDQMGDWSRTALASRARGRFLASQRASRVAEVDFILSDPDFLSRRTRQEADKETALKNSMLKEDEEDMEAALLEEARRDEARKVAWTQLMYDVAREGAASVARRRRRAAHDAATAQRERELMLQEDLAAAQREAADRKARKAREADRVLAFSAFVPAMDPSDAVLSRAEWQANAGSAKSPASPAIERDTSMGALDRGLSRDSAEAVRASPLTELLPRMATPESRQVTAASSLKLSQLSSTARSRSMPATVRTVQLKPGATSTQQQRGTATPSAGSVRGSRHRSCASASSKEPLPSTPPRRVLVHSSSGTLQLSASAQELPASYTLSGTVLAGPASVERTRASTPLLPALPQSRQSASRSSLRSATSSEAKKFLLFGLQV